MEKVPPHNGPETGYFLKLVAKTARYTFIGLSKSIAICGEMFTHLCRFSPRKEVSMQLTQVWSFLYLSLPYDIMTYWKWAQSRPISFIQSTS